MKIIAMLPVRNDAWVLPHSLACLSGFCDHILISDRQSEDGLRAICSRFPKVAVIDSSPDSRIREQRWQLLDAARQFDGRNLLWATDADELVSPAAVRSGIDRERDRLMPGTVFESRYVHLWNDAGRYRNDRSHYAPQWKQVAFVDDRRSDFDRSDRTALHEPRVPASPDAPVIQSAAVVVLHLQWLIPQRNQLKQAWYRCREFLDGASGAAAINAFYSVTLPAARVPLSNVEPDWIGELTFPDPAADLTSSWHQRDLLAWFDERGIEHFEPLEIWHIEALRDEFRRRVGRSPNPDRSYVPTWPVRAQQFGRRLLGAARRRLPV
jgi:Glycosyl transferase family 2